MYDCSIPDDFVAAINSLDEVWVPSDFSRGVLADSGVTADKVRNAVADKVAESGMQLCTMYMAR